MATTAYFVKKLGVMSVAKFGAVMGMIFGIIMGIVRALDIGPIAAETTNSMVFGVGSGIMTFCVNVLIWVFLGFIGGAIVAFIYNFALGEMGGIEVVLEVKQ
jgi:hypothetical protein